MRKINVTIICAADEEDTGCAAIVSSSPEFNIVTRASGLYAVGSWSAIARSDVVLLDEAVIDQDGTEAVRMVCDCYPLVRVMLVLDRPDERRAMEVLALGVTGIMMRSSIVSMLRKAIPVLCAGEAWVSRELVPGLRAESGRLIREKLN
jgi:DNA-binding NarL/FixJ family response regulator